MSHSRPPTSSVSVLSLAPPSGRRRARDSASLCVFCDGNLSALTRADRVRHLAACVQSQHSAPAARPASAEAEDFTEAAAETRAQQRWKDAQRVFLHSNNATTLCSNSHITRSTVSTACSALTVPVVRPPKKRRSSAASGCACPNCSLTSLRASLHALDVQLADLARVRASLSLEYQSRATHQKHRLALLAGDEELQWQQDSVLRTPLARFESINPPLLTGASTDPSASAVPSWWQLASARAQTSTAQFLRDFQHKQRLTMREEAKQPTLTLGPSLTPLPVPVPAPTPARIPAPPLPPARTLSVPVASQPHLASASTAAVTATAPIPVPAPLVASNVLAPFRAAAIPLPVSSAVLGRACVNANSPAVLIAPPSSSASLSPRRALRAATTASTVPFKSTESIAIVNDIDSEIDDEKDNVIEPFESTTVEAEALVGTMAAETAAVTPVFCAAAPRPRHPSGGEDIHVASPASSPVIMSLVSPLSFAAFLLDPVCQSRDFASFQTATLSRWHEELGMKPKSHRAMAERLEIMRTNLQQKKRMNSASPPMDTTSSLHSSAANTSLVFTVRSFIRGSEDLWLDCLLSQTLDFPSVASCLHGAGTTFIKAELAAVLDQEGVNFSEASRAKPRPRTRKRGER